MVKNFTSIKVANSLWEKTIGVMLWKDWGDYNGLLIKNNNSIHTFFVRFPIDLVFLDKDNKIVKLTSGLKPFHFSSFEWGAKHTLELPSGKIAEHKLAVGDQIILK